MLSGALTRYIHLRDSAKCTVLKNVKIIAISSTTFKQSITIKNGQSIYVHIIFQKKHFKYI